MPQHNTDWSEYYDAVEPYPARETVSVALGFWRTEPGFAVDLGCGTGRDTIELLRRGWRGLGVGGSFLAAEARARSGAASVF